MKGELLRPKRVINPELSQAAINGDVGFLNSLQKGDSRLQFILESASVGVETPLHVALRHGHVGFAMNILDLNSALAGIPDEGGCYPLHMAAARGYKDVVEKLLDIDRSLSLLRDKDGRTALTVAALNEKEDVLRALYPVYKQQVEKKVEVLRLLDPACKIERGLRQALAGDGDDGEELILHLCVVHNKLKSVEALVEVDEEVARKQHDICSPYEKLVQKKDANGNTALHYAAAEKNTEMLELLKGKMQNTDVTIRNGQGLTAEDIEKGWYTNEKWFLVKWILNRFTSKNSWDDWYKKDAKWTNEMHNTLMLLATLIVTVAFQAGVNPPGGFYSDEGQKLSLTVSLALPPRPPGTAIHNNVRKFRLFMYFDMIAFGASLTIILSLVSGFPLRHRFTTWMLVISVWIALTSMAMAFVFGTEVIIVNETVLDKIPYVLGAWMGLMGIILLGHCIILVGLLVEKIKQGGTLLKRGCQWILECNNTGTPLKDKAHKKDEECGKG